MACRCNCAAWSSGNDLEQAHMRNRQLIAAGPMKWELENNVIEKVERDGKHYFVINDYEALRQIFAEQLREIQRIKSEGDFDAGQNLIETYGVKVDREMHQEVLRPGRIARHPGVPRLHPATDGRGGTGWRDRRREDRTDTPDFVEWMLESEERFSFLPINQLSS